MNSTKVGNSRYNYNEFRLELCSYFNVLFFAEKIKFQLEIYLLYNITICGFKNFFKLEASILYLIYCNPPQTYSENKNESICMFYLWICG